MDPTEDTACCGTRKCWCLTAVDRAVDVQPRILLIGLLPSHSRRFSLCQLAYRYYTNADIRSSAGCMNSTLGWQERDYMRTLNHSSRHRYICSNTHPRVTVRFRLRSALIPMGFFTSAFRPALQMSWTMAATCYVGRCIIRSAQEVRESLAVR